MTFVQSQRTRNLAPQSRPHHRHRARARNRNRNRDRNRNRNRVLSQNLQLRSSRNRGPPRLLKI